MNKKYVLLVDDSKEDRYLIRRALEDSYELIEEGSYEEGMNRISLQFDKIDLVVLDYVLPSSSSSASERIKNFALELKIPVIFCSGNQHPPNKKMEDPWICKSDLQELLPQIKKILDA